MENYFWNEQIIVKKNKVYVLVIYDIVDNKKRVKMAKMLSGFGDRVQKSSFEAHLSERQYSNLLKQIPRYVDPAVDTVRVYRVVGSGEVVTFGVNNARTYEDVIIV